MGTLLVSRVMFHLEGIIIPHLEGIVRLAGGHHEFERQLDLGARRTTSDSEWAETELPKGGI